MTALVRAGLALLVTLAGAAYLWFFLRIVWRIGDEGSIVYGAQRIVEGQLPYRDFFEVMGPGAFYWLALWFEVLGVSWRTSRIAILTTALVSACAMYVISRRAYPSRIAILPPTFYTVVTIPLWPGANHHFDSNMWVVLAVALVMTAREVSLTRGVVTGVLLGVSSTIMPHKGVLVLLALVVDAAVRGRRSHGWWQVFRSVMAMTCGFGAVGMTVVLWFWSQGALAYLWYAMAVWPAQQYHAVNVVPYAHGLVELFLPLWRSVLDIVLPPSLSVAAAGVVVIPLAFVVSLPVFIPIFIVAAVRSRPWDRPHEDVLWTCVLSGLALFVSEIHRPDLMHLIYGSPLLLVVAFHWLGLTPNKVVIAARHAVVGSLITLAGLLAFIAGTAGVQVETRRGIVNMFDTDDALTFVHENVPLGETVFVYPYYPMYYFLGGVSNPTRFSILMYHINTRAQFEEVIRTLEREMIEYVLWDTRVAGENLTRWFPRYTHPPEGERVLEQYLNARYRILSVSRNGFQILQRRDDVQSPATTNERSPLFSEPRAEAVVGRHDGEVQE